MILLVSSTFLVQSNYYAVQSQRTGAHDNARVATELIASEIRSSMDDAIVTAGARTLTVRSPIVLAMVCDGPSSGNYDIHTEGGESGLDTDEVAGVALRAADGSWSYVNAAWGTLNGSDAGSASDCQANGADTVGAYQEFHRLLGVQSLFSPSPQRGDVVMLFRETTFKIQTSELEPSGLGLFRGVYGDSLVEFATGIDSTAQFQYRTGGGTYADTINALGLPDIDAVRIVADARKRAQTGGQDDLTFGWSVNVALRNVR